MDVSLLLEILSSPHVQINEVKGYASAVLVPATFEHVFWTAEYTYPMLVRERVDG